MTIDRAIEILNPEHREHYESIDPVNEACRMGMEALERTRWIPCSERLPEDKIRSYLCWYEYFRYGSYNAMYQTCGIGYYCNGRWGGEVAQGQKAKVLAWMPLPEPPKEENDETMKRLTVEHWQNLDPWECCGQDNYCIRPSNKPGGCRNGCIVPKLYTRLAQYEDTGLSPMGMHLLPSAPKEGGTEK